MKQILNSFVLLKRSINRRLSKYLISRLLKTVGSNFVCDEGVKIYNHNNISLGDNVVLNYGVILQSCEGAPIEIGNNVTISYNSKILTGGLNLNDFKDVRERSHEAGKVIIGDNVWIGANTIILPGVTIPNNSVFASGSIVSKSFKDENFLYAGVPAKPIKKV